MQYPGNIKGKILNFNKHLSDLLKMVDVTNFLLQAGQNLKSSNIPWMAEKRESQSISIRSWVEKAAPLRKQM